MNSRSESEEYTISVLAPLYKEERNVRPLALRLRSVFQEAGCPWELVFALDPSPDGTEEQIIALIKEDFPVRLVTFSRRIGKPLSLMAGLDHVSGDACVIMDADLQDPPELIPEMVEQWKQGYKVVIAKRRSRKGENYLYLKAAALFYRLLEKISEVDIPRDAGDFRLVDKEVVKHMRSFRERHGFFRGVCASVGFPTQVTHFDRDPRHTGKTQISWLGSLNIALDGIVPFSRTPVRALFWAGAGLVSLSVLISLICAALRLTGISGPLDGYLLAILAILFMGGLILTGQGVLGEYLVRTYEETRQRPLYIVDKVIEAKSLISRKEAEGAS
jgi:dolichol-phosphate mannosyltransferase